MRWLSLLLIGILLSVAALNASAGNVAYNKHWVRKVPVHVVTVNLNSPNVRRSPAISQHGIGSSEGFGSMLSRLHPTAAITGTYFCLRTLVPVGDIVVDGQIVNTGSVGTGVCFTSDNIVHLRAPSPSYAKDWSIYTSVLCTGPRLVRDGIAYVNPWAEGFRDRALYRPARRSALGLTANNKLLLVTVNKPIYLSKLAHIMHDLGAVDAVNLDGGSSTAIYYKGRVPSHPGRRLTNLIVVYESPDKFAQIKPELAPLQVIAQSPSKS